MPRQYAGDEEMLIGGSELDDDLDGGNGIWERRRVNAVKSKSWLK